MMKFTKHCQSLKVTGVIFLALKDDVVVWTVGLAWVSSVVTELLTRDAAFQGSIPGVQPYVCVVFICSFLLFYYRYNIK